jgi:hypothetical protein
VHFCINGMKGSDLRRECLLAPVVLELGPSELGLSELGLSDVPEGSSAWSCREGAKRESSSRMAYTLVV